MLGGIGTFVGWNGKNDAGERERAALVIYNQITENTDIKRDTLINLVGHSHGGNVMILVANMLSGGGYSNINLLTLETPVRDDYKLESSGVKHTQLYSNRDWVQTLGGGFEFGLTSTWTLGMHQYSSAKNIDTTMQTQFYLSKTNTYQTIVSNSGGFAPCPYHQMSRSVNYILEALGYDK